MTSPSGNVSSGNTGTTINPTLGPSSGGTAAPPSPGLAPFNSTLGSSLPLAAGYNEPSIVTNFGWYLPPGVYMNPQGGPQLAVNSIIPRSIGIVGQALGYEVYTQTVQVNADIQGTLPSVSNVSPTTAGVSAVSAIQTLTVSGAPTAGNFSLSYGSSDATTLSWPATASQIATALQNLATASGTVVIGSSGVTVTANTSNTQFYVQFQGPMGSQPVDQLTVTSALTGGTNPEIVVSDTNSVQVITISGVPTGGTFQLAVGGPSTPENVTIPTASNSTPASGANVLTYDVAANDGGTGITPNVQAALENIVGTGNVSVTSIASGVYQVEFRAALAGVPMPQIAVASQSLTGTGNPEVSVQVINQIGVKPVDAVQTIQVAANSGTFTLTYGGQTTSAMEYNTQPSIVSAALQSLSTIGPQNVSVTGGPSGSTGGNPVYTVTFAGALAGTPVSTITGAGASSLTPTPSQTLSQAGINTSTIKVQGMSTGVTYVQGVDYIIVSAAPGAGQPITAPGTPSSLYAIERTTSSNTGGSGIQPGDLLQVSYQFTDAGYYAPYQFYTYSDVVEAYGAPFDTTTGGIQSGISLCAKLAFLNGAYSVVCAAVQPTSTTQGTSVATYSDYQNALDALKDQPPISVVTVDTGDPEVQTMVGQHVAQQSMSRFERRAILGCDGTVAPVQSSQRIQLAQNTLEAQAAWFNGQIGTTASRVMMISPATFNYFAEELNSSIILGGQYIAAAVAGLSVALPPAMPLTKKTIAGFTGVGELEQSGMKDVEASNGLAVVEFTRNQLIQIRHGLSTNPASLVTREWSIIGQQDAMVYTLRDFLESDNLIGQPIYPYTLMNVKGSAEAALQSLIANGNIVDYTGLTVRQLASNPDVLEVKFNWLPAMPLNYIVATFSISLSSGNVTTNTGSSANTENVTNTQQSAANIAYPSTAYGGSVMGGQTGANSFIPTQQQGNDFGGPTNTLQST